jgi:DNA polymerase III delta prime subunit
MDPNELSQKLIVLEKLYPDFTCDASVHLALADLHAMIGMKKLKAYLCGVMQRIVMAKIKPKVGKHTNLLHMALIGPPGTGKTTVGEIVARIISGLHILKRPSKKSTVTSSGECCNPVLALKRLRRDTEIKHAEFLYELERTGRALHVKRMKTNMNNHVRELRFASAPKEIINHVLASRRAVIASLPPLPPLGDKKIKSSKQLKPIFHIGTVTDLKAEFLGQSGPKTRAFYTKCFGGVAMIDECYDLFNPAYSSGDAFGSEILGVTVDFMTRYAESLMIIFAGYAKRTREMIKQQEGLASRISFICEFDEYDAAELVQIFEVQLKRAGWEHDVTSAEICARVETQRTLKVLTNGRHMQQLVTKCIEQHARKTFAALFEPENEFPDKIDLSMLDAAFSEFDRGEPDDTPMHLYT